MKKMMHVEIVTKICVNIVVEHYFIMMSTDVKIASKTNVIYVESMVQWKNVNVENKFV
jgi:hypothetical protein